MSLPYLRRKNAGCQVQIRLPVTLDPRLRLSQSADHSRNAHRVRLVERGVIVVLKVKEERLAG
jgi:hypothetical protein